MSDLLTRKALADLVGPGSVVLDRIEFGTIFVINNDFEDDPEVLRQIEDRRPIGSQVFVMDEEQFSNEIAAMKSRAHQDGIDLALRITRENHWRRRLWRWLESWFTPTPTTMEEE